MTGARFIGLFGGTFDPVHLGHLNAINRLSDELEFEHVYWVLSARPPHKSRTSASIEHRFAMLKLALAGYDRYVPDDTEISRSSISYTIDTVKTFQQRDSGACINLIIGGDSLAKLDTWHRYLELIEQVNLIVMHRPGYSLDVPEYLRDRLVPSVRELADTIGKMALFEQTEFDISSTQLRKALSINGSNDVEPECVAEYLPLSVKDYIQQQQLYKSNRMNSEQVKDQVVDALEGVKGQDINIINIADISDFADYMVVVSGTSDTHVKALAREASNNLRTQGVKPLSEDGADIGEWVLVDFGDVVLHVMRPEVREYYDLEKLWDEDVRNMVKQHREQQES